MSDAKAETLFAVVICLTIVNAGLGLSFICEVLSFITEYYDVEDHGNDARRKRRRIPF